jgi:hypothetical protein
MDTIVDPALFLHRLDFGTRRATFVRTSPKALKAASFIDGRERFWRGEQMKRPFISLPQAPPPNPARYIFHVGFCGSTLLARLLDTAEAVMVLREPQALTDLSAYRAALDRSDLDDHRFYFVLPRVSALLFRPWLPPDHIVIKPSNWVNNLAPALCADYLATRPLFLTVDRETFLTAVLRGGTDRLAFVARLAVHLSSHGEGPARQVERALAGGGEHLDTLLRLAAAAYRLQRDLLRSAGSKWPDVHWLDFNHLKRDPVSALDRARLALQLPNNGEIADFHHHAKQPTLLFSSDDERAANLAIDERYGRQIRAACDWDDT